MKTVVVHDAYIVCCEGKYYFPTQVSTNIKRYYEHFGKLSIIGRGKKVDQITASYEDVTYLLEEVLIIPSLEKFMLGSGINESRRIIKNSDFVIFRCPGIISHRVADIARKYHKPYFVEVMACAWDSLWNHSIKGKILAPYVFLKMRKTVRNTDYALYVTTEFLQKRYPCKCESVGVTDTLIKDIDDTILENRLSKIEKTDFRQLTLMTVAAVNVRYKGQEFVIKAIPKLNEAGIRVKYILVGGGDQSYLKNVAEKYGVLDQVEFAGRKAPSEVMKLLDSTDIYMQPSLQEGLPRAVVEAMSRGCPIIGARTGGIPELISEENIVERKSIKGIAKMIDRIANKKKLEEMAVRNFNYAKTCHETFLDKKRNDYYEYVLAHFEKNI